MSLHRLPNVTFAHMLNPFMWNVLVYAVGIEIVTGENERVGVILRASTRLCQVENGLFLMRVYDLCVL